MTANHPTPDGGLREELGHGRGLSQVIRDGMDAWLRGEAVSTDDVADFLTKRIIVAGYHRAPTTPPPDGTANDNPRMSIVVQASRWAEGEWIVEAVDDGSEGEVYTTIFAGPKAEERATAYRATLSERAPPDGAATFPAWLTELHEDHDAAKQQGFPSVEEFKLMGEPGVQPEPGPRGDVRSELEGKLRRVRMEGPNWQAQLADELLLIAESHLLPLAARTPRSAGDAE